MDLFIGDTKEIFFFYYFFEIILYKKTLMGYWMQEKMEENDGSGYAIKFYISVICKNNKLFT